MSKKSTEPKFYKDASRLVEDETIVLGTAVTYFVTEDDHAAYQCDYEIDSRGDSRPQDTRAYRSSNRKNGQIVSRLSVNRLGGEMAVLFGPEVSPANASRGLRRLADCIEKTGLLIGRDQLGDFQTEKVDDEIVE